MVLRQGAKGISITGEAQLKFLFYDYIFLGNFSKFSYFSAKSTITPESFPETSKSFRFYRRRIYLPAPLLSRYER